MGVHLDLRLVSFRISCATVRPWNTAFQVTAAQTFAEALLIPITLIWMKKSTREWIFRQFKLGVFSRVVSNLDQQTWALECAVF